MASPASRREFRFRTYTTFRDSFSNAANGNLNALDGTAYKTRLTEYDPSGLVQENFPDETLRTRFHVQGTSINGLRKGTFTGTMYFGGAWSNISATPEELLMKITCGGQALPTTARTGAIQGTDSTTTSINVATINTRIVVGQGVFIGAKGDGRGNGEFKPVNALAADGNIATLAIACKAAPSSGDAVVYSSTTYPDEDATQELAECIAIGHGTADQRQMVNCVPTFTISGYSPGETPKIQFDFQASDHQWVDTNERTTLTPTRLPRGQEPAYGRGVGMIQIGDFGSPTRNVEKAGDITFEPGLSFEEIPEPTGLNGIGGYLHMPGTPTMEMTLLVDEDYGLVADHNAQTAKTIIVQLGHAQGAMCAIEIPKCYLDKMPESAALNNLQGMKIMVHGDEPLTTGTDLQKAVFRIHKG
jgi:hypothetical protein